MNPNDNNFIEAKILLARIASINNLYGKLASYYLNDGEKAKQFILETAEDIVFDGHNIFGKKLLDDIILFANRERINNKLNKTT
jgi:hypothetical protein